MSQLYAELFRIVEMEFAVVDDVVQHIDGQSFDIALQNAADMKWSGILRAMKDDEQVGVVVMRDGHIAWAVSNSQKENFGSFLERIGMVPKERLDEVIQKYRSLGKSKKLGALLEEAGLISHSALRECLKAHVKAAISSMLEDPGILLEARDGEMAIDASLIFLLSEVYPGAADVLEGECHLPEEGSPLVSQEETGAEVCEDSGEEAASADYSALLGELDVLPGYQYSLLADTTGALHSLHSAEGVPVNSDHVVRAVQSWLNMSCLGSDEIGMGTVSFAFIQSEKGSLFAQMTGTENRHFIAVACDENAKLGVVKHKISELIPAVRMLTNTA